MNDRFFVDITLITRTARGTASGWKYEYTDSKTIKGKCLIKSIAEQTQSALLKNDKIQYQLSTYKDDLLEIGQVFKWVENGITKYAIVKNLGNISPEGSAVENLQIYDAETYIMEEKNGV